MMASSGVCLYLHSQLDTWLQWIGQRQLQEEARVIEVLEFGASYIKDFTVVMTAHWRHLQTPHLRHFMQQTNKNMVHVSYDFNCQCCLYSMTRSGTLFKLKIKFWFHYQRATKHQLHQSCYFNWRIVVRCFCCCYHQSFAISVTYCVYITPLWDSSN